MSKIELDYEQRQRVESALEWMSDFPDEAAAELIYLRDRIRTAEEEIEPEPEQTMVPRCRCCGYLVTESEHKGCLRTPQPEPTDDERAETSIYDIADEHARSVRQMCADHDYVLPTLIAAHMRLLAERVDNRRRKIESTRHVIDSAIKKHDARRQPVQDEADEESGEDHE